MIIVMKPETPEAEIERFRIEFCMRNVAIEKILDKHIFIFGLAENSASLDPLQIEKFSPWIEKVLQTKKPFEKSSLEDPYDESSNIAINTPNGKVTFRKNYLLVVIAETCSVKNEEIILAMTQYLQKTETKLLQKRAYKLGISPHSFQDYNNSAFKLLTADKKSIESSLIIEVINTADVEKVAEVADIIQIGARNMKNFALLKKVGSQNKPVLLKQDISTTINDWLMAAEYILKASKLKNINITSNRNQIDSSV